MRDEAQEAVHYAERVVWVAGWRIQEARVLAQLADRPGLACGRLEPRSDSIQLVTYDGKHLGHVRRDGPPGRDERWVAVPKDARQTAGSFETAQAAAWSLAVAAGRVRLAGWPAGDGDGKSDR